MTPRDVWYEAYRRLLRFAWRMVNWYPEPVYRYDPSCVTYTTSWTGAYQDIEVDQ